MRTIVKSAALLAALTMLFRKRKSGGSRSSRSEGRGMWRKTPPNPDSYDKYGDLG